VESIHFKSKGLKVKTEMILQALTKDLPEGYAYPSWRKTHRNSLY
jgi:hypothetical protein